MVRRDSVALLSSVLAAAIGLTSLFGALTWIDRPFPGFLLLGNQVVASAGLASWPGLQGRQIYQAELVAVDGKALSDSHELYTYVRQLPAGTEVNYEFEKLGQPFSEGIRTQLFTISDFLLLFGPQFLSGLVLLGVAFAIRFLARRDPAAIGCSLALGTMGIWALTSLDLYSPYRFFRLHVLAECLVPAATIHMAFVFPVRRRPAISTPWLIPACYLCTSILALASELTLFQAEAYVVTHRMVLAAMTIAFIILIVSQVTAFVWPESFEARQRVKVLAMGTVAVVTPSLFVSLGSAMNQGQSSENLMSWAGIFFPISIGYAVLKDDLLRVDEILRRSVSYTLLTVVVAIAYSGAFAAFELLFSGSSWLTRWFSMALFAGLTVFVLLPVRDRVQGLVDRLFFRSTYDFRLVVEEASQRFARVTDLKEMTSYIRSSVSQVLQPETISLEVVESGERPKAVGPPQEPRIVENPRGGLLVPFNVGGAEVARLALGRKKSGRFYSGGDRVLLQTLSNQGAVAIENALALERLRELNRTLEKRVSERTAELASTLSELKSTQVHLVQSERLAAIGELSAGVAHEVNNPLNFARNSLALLMDRAKQLRSLAIEIDNLDPDNSSSLGAHVARLRDRHEAAELAVVADEFDELAQIVTEGLDRTSRLVADLRDFAAPGHREFAPVNIVAGIDSTLQLLSHKLKESRVAVMREFPADLPPARGNIGALNQVFLNVVKNAIEALDSQSADDSKLIQISAQQMDQKLVITVRDNGPGLDDRIRNHLFEPFVTTKEAGKGTGLGLSMCKRILDQHAGRIDLSSDPAGGTRVTVELPVHPSDA